ncbi:MAG: FAD-dependent thymidylate synthase [Ignisphaera sp.]|nr:FAD-dependent thymidylate synthase [Ignisphaera sp.]
MKVTLLNEPTLEFVDLGIGMCWGKGGYGYDTEKGKERIDRVCNKNQHSSMLRFVQYIFEVELSTSALLEWTRHQVGIDYAVKSTRYCTKQDGDNISVEHSKNDIVNNMIDIHINDIKLLIEHNPSVSNDDIKLLLPQAFIYKMQVQFNAQSLQHFIKLRSDKSAHYHIRDLANLLYLEIPTSHHYLFTDSLKVYE